MTTGEVIRRIRKSLGMTQSELGAVLGYTQPAISQLEHDGAAVHDVRVLRRVAKALQVPLAILVVESNEEADVQRRQFFKTAALGAGAAAPVAVGSPSLGDRASATDVKIGPSDVAEIKATIGQLRDLDWVIGGDRLCQVAAGQVRYIEQLLDMGSYTDDIGRELTSAAAEMMTAAGWIYFDAGRREESRQYYARAAQAGNAAGDNFAVAQALLNASTLATTGAISYGTGSRPGEGVRLAEAAQSTALKQGGPHLRTLVALREAVAHGAVGDKTAVGAATSRAHRAYESSRGHDPEWVYLPEVEVNALTGIAFMAAGEHEVAEQHLHAAIRGGGGGPFQAHTTVRLAQNHIKAGDIAEGCGLLNSHFDKITSVASTRLQVIVDGIAQDVRPQANVPEVREFLGRAGERV
ncbi:helix-turn-helix domain-containing protein [Nocardia sp. BMG51109]|uniref:helix-turn-helix domain-containing protein n=1 Tax=Nocardia sp. BMG51109 TaxID=1056816 RepID=UPI0018DBD4D0|nr:helix-turn-helix domain-containing protein [Nocardia sp. BMG51109]